MTTPVVAVLCQLVPPSRPFACDLQGDRAVIVSCEVAAQLRQWRMTCPTASAIPQSPPRWGRRVLKGPLTFKFRPICACGGPGEGRFFSNEYGSGFGGRHDHRGAKREGSKSQNRTIEPNAACAHASSYERYMFTRTPKSGVAIQISPSFISFTASLASRCSSNSTKATVLPSGTWERGMGAKHAGAKSDEEKRKHETKPA